MPTTEKLYETDPYLQNFTAVVRTCAPDGGAYTVTLDRTAFYPEGGGQPCDTGVLGGGAVSAVHAREGVVLHTVDRPLTPGSAVTGRIDWARRLDHMQQHTGEHILSGTLHRLFGAENVGFHIGAEAVRMDTDIPLTAARLAEAEAAANAAVRADAPVRAWYPAPGELAALTYRSKKAIEGAVRLVDAGGADLCACCGTHLARTGEVGAIKILSAQHYKGGTRLAVACGGRATAAVAAAWQDAEGAGVLLSAGVGRLTPALQRLQEAEAGLKARLAATQNALADALAEGAAPGQAAVFFCPGADGDGLRRICLAVAGKTGAACAVFAPGGQGLAYALSAPGDARPLCRALNGRFGGRGGGTPAFCQGSLPAGCYEEAKAFLLAAPGPI